MASIALHVPATLVELIHDEFVRYRDVQFDVLQSRAPRDRSARQRRAATLVWAVDIALHTVPWDDLGPDQSIELTADRILLREVVYATLLGVVDRLHGACHRGCADLFAAGLAASDDLASRMDDDGFADIRPTDWAVLRRLQHGAFPSASSRRSWRSASRPPASGQGAGIPRLHPTRDPARRRPGPGGLVEFPRLSGQVWAFGESLGVGGE